MHCVKCKNMYKRSEYQIIKKRLEEQRRFIQVVMGARQIGKSTVVKQVLKDLEEPVKQIAANAGLEGSVIIDKIVRSRKVGYGFDAYSETYVDMIPAGIVDPTKVTRSALQNAASVAAMVLTTESLVTDIKEEAPAAAPAGGMGGMGSMY